MESLLTLEGVSVPLDSRPTFALPGGQRMAALTSREMREVDRIAVDETGPGLLQMMEHAGRSMAVLA